MSNYVSGDIMFMGQSLGGGLATAQALATGKEAIVFNPAAVNLQTLRSNSVLYNQPQFDAYISRHVAVYNVQGDALTGMQNTGKYTLSGIESRLMDVTSPVRNLAAGQVLRRYIGSVDELSAGPSSPQARATFPAMQRTPNGRIVPMAGSLASPKVGIELHLMPHILMGLNAWTHARLPSSQKP